MKSIGKRVIQYAGKAVTVVFNHPAIEELLERIIYPFPAPVTQESIFTIQVELTHAPQPTYRILLDGRPVYQSTNQVDFLEILLSKICYQLAYDSKDGLLLHAGGLGYRQIGILVPGGIGFGKSTFTAWMVAKGCDYFSDEFVYFPWESNQMISFYRPLHLKKPSHQILNPYIKDQTADHLFLCGSHSDLVNPILFNSDNHYDQPPIQLILFPRYQAGGQFTWEELTPAAAGLELMQFLINARNLPEHGFGEVTRIARNVKAIKFSYSAFEQIEDILMDVIYNLSSY